MSNETKENPVILQSGASYIEFAGQNLTVGNDHFRRTWRVEANGLLSAQSFLHRATGAEWLTSAPGQTGPKPAAELPEETRTVTLAAILAPSVIEAESLTAELTATGQAATIVYRLQVFPDASGVRICLRVTGNTVHTIQKGEASTETEPTGVELDPTPHDSPGQTTNMKGDRDILESLTLAPHHLCLTQVTLQDQTDHYNELVFEKEWLLHPSERALSLSGCLFYVEDVVTGAGLIFLKESPLPHACPVQSPYDFYVEPIKQRFAFAGHGTDGVGEGYSFITLAYDGGTVGRVAALQQYQRCLRPYVPGRDGMLVSNTWGDRNRDARIQADFMAQEIEAGARLGVDVIQIDDGWQVGATSNSVRAKSEGGVWEGFYTAWDNFWAVNPERFPNGLTPLMSDAREKGMRFGLWFGPDSAGDFANWQRDADTILQLHRELNIDYIKIDGVKVRSKIGERNLKSFIDHVLSESSGRVTFDLDITAEVRPGYFGVIRNGPLFVENRYTDWHKYWPHQTLRNLWKLAYHVDPLRLRMEWLNHERNREMYTGDPIAPDTYRPDYLFATVMFGSPLGWFEVSNLPESYFTEAAPLIATWKSHREAIFSGTILPIGDAPDGVSWTGFASISQDRRSVYLLVFREASPSAEWEVSLPFLSDVEQAVTFTLLGGEGEATLLPGQRLAVTIPASHRFLFVHGEVV